MSGRYRSSGSKGRWLKRAAFTCAACGKRGYASRDQAEKAARLLHPGERMRAYQCGPLWHLTSQDAATAAWYREQGS